MNKEQKYKSALEKITGFFQYNKNKAECDKTCKDHHVGGLNGHEWCWKQGDTQPTQKPIVKQSDSTLTDEGLVLKELLYCLVPLETMQQEPKSTHIMTTTAVPGPAAKTHGSCCYCQTCGKGHDDCKCEV